MVSPVEPPAAAPGCDGAEDGKLPAGAEQAIEERPGRGEGSVAVEKDADLDAVLRPLGEGSLEEPTDRVITEAEDFEVYERARGPDRFQHRGKGLGPVAQEAATVARDELGLGYSSHRSAFPVFLRTAASDARGPRATNAA